MEDNRFFIKYISSTNLANWAPERDSQEHFPLLIRRLIKASPVEVITMRFPVSDNVILPGLDGALHINGSFPYIPSGHSVWEMGAGKDYRDKAYGDYLKRTNEISEEERSSSTFVFATPYVWFDNET